MIFLRIPANSISTYALDNDIPSYPSQINFLVYTRQWYSFVSSNMEIYVSTRQWYSFVSSTHWLLRIYLTTKFFRILANSKFYVYTRLHASSPHRYHVAGYYLRLINSFTGWPRRSRRKWKGLPCEIRTQDEWTVHLRICLDIRTLRNQFHNVLHVDTLYRVEVHCQDESLSDDWSWPS